MPKPVKRLLICVDNSGYEVSLERRKIYRFRALLLAIAATTACLSICVAADPSGNTPLILAAWRGDLTEVKQLLKSGADVNASNRMGMTPLMASTWGKTGRGEVEVAKVLIANGAKVNAGDVYGKTALMEVAASGNLEFVELLLTSGADVNAEFRPSLRTPAPPSHLSFPGTALQGAATNGRVEIMKELMTRGANVNATNQLGQTALMFACQYDCPPGGPCTRRKEMVSMLLAAGADVNAKDYAGKTALRGFVGGGTGEEKQEIKRLLREAGATEPPQGSPNAGPDEATPKTKRR